VLLKRYGMFRSWTALHGEPVVGVSMAALNTFTLLVATLQIATIRIEPIVALPWQHGTLTLLVATLQINNNTNRTHCCCYVAALNTFTLLVATLQIATIRIEPIVVLPW
jgi:hypothetical protein